MDGQRGELSAEVSEIKARLAEIQESLRHFEASGGQTEIQIYPQGRGDILEVMVSQQLDDVEEGLYRNMVKRCEMREPCRATFTAFLQKNASLLEHDTVREEVIITNQDELDRLRETAPYDK